MTDISRNGPIPTAIYHDQQLVEYQENPLIRALPPVPEIKQVVKELRLLPDYDPAESCFPGHLRVHALCRLLHHFFQPMNHHLALEQKISLMIRQGYIGRNPENGAFYQHLQNGFRRVEEENLDAAVYQSTVSTALCISLFGCSGSGKSRTLERILGMYPQCMHHPDYNITQLVYLKLDCPIDGDLDELCLGFFNAVDKVLGTQYSRSHGRKKLGTKRLLASMCQIANLHALGVLIIDEVQNLNEARSGGAEKMHNFFVSLVNTIGVPVIQVGTHRARKFFQRTFRAARRITGISSFEWDRLPNDRQWHQMLERLWKYQWLQQAGPLDDELVEVMYDLTQGVMDIVIKLFVLAQMRAIVTGAETLNSALLKKVFADDFKPVHPMLAALRSGRTELIAKYDDLLMPDIENKMLALGRSVDDIDIPLIPTPVEGDKAKKLAMLLQSMGTPADVAIPMADDLVARNPDAPMNLLMHKATANYVQDKPVTSKSKVPSRIKQSEWAQMDTNDLRRIYVEGPPDAIHDRCQQSGLIMDLDELLGVA
ncbi:Transposon Tn7 transposition protein TnsC [Halomonadaceae bacterium LMG 33818]|uniref:AAA family ATPase n=1 Tax=Cernens ardua TaxID=3402176 RepID=UPI003EDC2B36